MEFQRYSWEGKKNNIDYKSKVVEQKFLNCQESMYLKVVESSYEARRMFGGRHCLPRLVPRESGA